jgi:hypothetical protein
MGISSRFLKNHTMLNVLTMPKVWSIILVKENPVENRKIFTRKIFLNILKKGSQTCNFVAVIYKTKAKS